MPSWNKRWRPSLLAAAALAAYAGAFGGSFQFDDFNVIVHQAAVHSLGAWWDSMPGIRPLLKLSYALSWIAGGGGETAFHLVNVALHAAATAGFPGGALFAQSDDKAVSAFDLRNVATALGLKQGCIE